MSRGGGGKAPGARAMEIFRRLKKASPDAGIELEFSNPLELLVATVLSAQCTDVRVNAVTRILFATYRKPGDYLAAPAAELEADIRSTGFFRQKARSLRGIMEALLARHGGEVPGRMEELLALPGVGRKTANVVLGNAFGVPGIVVDTHVSRVSQRLGLTAETDPAKIETDLGALLPRRTWNEASRLLVLHGRYVCKARKPLHDTCVLADICPSRGD